MANEGGGNVTVLLHRVREGDEQAGAELFSLLYGELRGMAGRIFRSQRAGHTLEPTALVHEAYLKMIRPDAGHAPWQDRAHFCRIAARAMRQILVNHARDKAALKRGGGLDAQRVTMSEALAPGLGKDLDILAVHEALEGLAALDERQARIAELRFFTGLTNPEVAEVLGVSPRTVELDWTMAKSWLAAKLSPTGE